MSLVHRWICASRTHAPVSRVSRSLRAWIPRDAACRVVRVVVAAAALVVTPAALAGEHIPGAAAPAIVAAEHTQAAPPTATDKPAPPTVATEPAPTTADKPAPPAAATEPAPTAAGKSAPPAAANVPAPPEANDPAPPAAATAPPATTADLPAPPAAANEPAPAKANDPAPPAAANAPVTTTAGKPAPPAAANVPAPAKANDPAPPAAATAPPATTADLPAPPAAPAAPATASEPSLAGHWEGAIDIPGARLAIDVDFTKAPDGSFSGDISIPAQGAKDMPLAHISFAGAAAEEGAAAEAGAAAETGVHAEGGAHAEARAAADAGAHAEARAAADAGAHAEGGAGAERSALAFDLPGPQGNPTFRGVLSSDASSITGEFTQSGQTFPFHLDRAAPPEALAKDALAGFGDFIVRSMKDWKVPGLALAIVKDGKLVLSEGYGQRDAGRNLPVTTKTLFAIGSATKAFTTFTLGTLVDEGTLAWDKPVAATIPGFKLYDPDATAHMTARDLVTHRSGLPRHDLVWYNSPMTRKEMVARLPYLEPSKDFRAEFHYQNLMFLVAGYVVEQLTGRSWEQNVQQRIFERLGMSHSNFSVADSQKSQDYALPYEEKDEVVKAMPFRDITNVGPAGSINSSVEEMTQWVLLHLNKGKAGGARIINEATLIDMHTPHMAIAAPIERPELPQMTYGMGWFIQPYRGHNRIHHGGNIDGFSAMVSFLPQDQIGMVILTNMNGTPLPELLMRHALDRLLKLAPIDWCAEALAKQAQAKALQKEAEKKKDTVRKPGTVPAHKLEDYAGAYENPGYGTLAIRLRGDRLEAAYNGITTPLEHWHYEVFNGAKGAEDPVFEDMKFGFLTNLKGDVEAVEAPFEPEVKNIVFRRKPDARLSDPQYLEQFLGTYQLGPQTVTLGLRGSTLTLSVPGQPVYELVADRNDTFTLKDVSVISVRFTIDPRDGVTGIVFNQPNGVFTGKKKP